MKIKLKKKVKIDAITILNNTSLIRFLPKFSLFWNLFFSSQLQNSIRSCYFYEWKRLCKWEKFHVFQIACHKVHGYLLPSKISVTESLFKHRRQFCFKASTWKLFSINQYRPWHNCSDFSPNVTLEIESK
jgi:hypothetical protein